MKLIVRIARTELKYYFYSPIAWFVLIIFIYFNSGILLNALDGIAGIQDANNDLLDGKFEGMGISLTSAILGESILSSVSMLLLFLPLITTNVINKDFTQGTIKLLNSSPVKNYQIVLGKYIGAMAFVLFMVGAVLLVYLISAGMIKHVDYPWIFTMFLGFMLVASVYVAIGIYISSLSTYPIMAGLLTIFVLFLFQILGMFFQYIDWYRDLIFHTRLVGRVNSFLVGLISTKEIVYYVLFTTLFLVFTVNKLHAKIVSKSRMRLLLKNVGIFLIVIVLIALSSIHGYIGYWDTTREQINTIDKRVQNMLASMDGSAIKATLYTNILGARSEDGAPSTRNQYEWGFWERYLRFYPNIEFEYVYYYAIDDADTARFRQTYPDKSLEEIARIAVKNNMQDFSKYLGPDEIKNLIDLSEEDKSLCMTIEYKGKKSFLRTYPEQFLWPKDVYNMAGALQHLLQDTMPRFKFLAANNERSPFKTGEREYGGIFNSKWNRYALINSYLFCDTIKELVPSEIYEKDVLILADPRSAYAPNTLDSIQAYINSGKNLFVLAEPDKNDIINPVLRQIGLETLPGTLVVSTTDELPDKMEGRVTESAVELINSVRLAQYRSGGTEHIHASYLGVAALSINSNALWDTLGYIDNRDQLIWLKREAFVNDSAALVFNPATDMKVGDKIMMGGHLKRMMNNREQKIIAFSDADMLSNQRGSEHPFAGILSYLMDDVYPVGDFFNGTAPDVLLTVNKGQVKTFKVLISYVFTGLLLLTGMVILIRRKRQ